jgi:hypothetical protein
MVRQINGVEITSVHQMVNVLKTPNQGWLIVMERGGREIKLVVR